METGISTFTIKRRFIKMGLPLKNIGRYGSLKMEIKKC